MTRISMQTYKTLVDAIVVYRPSFDFGPAMRVNILLI